MMSKKSVIIICFIIVCFISCTDESNSTGPNKEIEPDLVETIDSEGGTLETDDVHIVIPGGAFSSSTELNLFSNINNDFSDNSVTPAFELAGLPNSFSKPIRLSIKYTGNLSEEKYISLGTLNKNPLIGDTTFIYELISAEDSSGYLVGHIKPRMDDSYEISKRTSRPFKNDTDNKRLRFAGVNRYRKSKINDRFNIYYPEVAESHISSLNEVLDECYETVTEKLGFSFDDFEGIFPIKVTIKNMDGMYNQFRHAESGFGGISPYITEQIFFFNINANSLMNGQMQYIKQEFGIGLAGIVMLCYGGLKPSLSFTADYYWLCTAVQHWSEEYFSEPGEFTAPRRFVHNEIMPFLGICTGARNKYYGVERHGRGMSAVIKYLTDDPAYGIKGPAKTYELIRSGSLPPSALINSVDRMLVEWWPGFFHDYVAGDVYNVDGSFFLDPNYISSTWKIDDDQDTEHIITSSAVDGYYNLSAKLFLVDLDYSEFNDTDNLLIDADSYGANDDGIAVIVFGVKNNTLQFLGESINGDAVVELEDLKDYYDNNWRQFLIVVVNSLGEPPFLDKSSISLKLEVKQASPPVFNTCKIRLKCHLFYIREYQAGQTEYYDTDVSLENVTFHEGSFTGNTFTSNYEYKNNPHTYTREGTIVVVLDEAHDNVVSFTMDDVKTYVGYEDVEESISISAENIPLYPDFYSATAFILKGASVQDHITHLSHEKDWESWGERIIDYESNENSGIYVFFRE